MAVITVEGQQVTVGPEFDQLSPEQQNATVDEIAKSLGLTPQQPTEAYQPSAVPFMDQINSFANSAVNAIPIVGPKLTEAGNNVDAWVNNTLGFEHQTPEDRAQINASEQAKFPLAAGAGTVAGTVAPLMVAGAPALGGRLLGMTGGLGSQIGFGAGSGALISGADTLARGGDLHDAGNAALVGGAMGGAAPLVFKGLGAGFNALTGRGVPKAAQNVAQALGEDGINPASVNTALRDMGPGASVMDLGPNMQTLAGGVASVRGPGQKVLREAVTTRAKAASPRMAADIGKTLGNGQDLGALTEQIVTAQKAAADPLYAAVRNKPIELAGNIKFVSQTPMGKAAFAKAVESAANDGITVPSLGRVTTVGLVDYAKQALDDIAGTAKRAGQNNVARQASQMAKLLTTETDKLAPGYKAAREAFAGPAAVLDAIETGQGAFKADTSPAAMRSALNAMTASEKDAFLQGAQASVADMIGNATNDIRKVRDLLRKPYNEAKLRVLIGSDATDELLRAVDREFMFGQTAHVVAGNSETARRTAAQGMVDPNFQDVRQPPQGVTGMVFAALNAARSRIRATTQPKVNRQMADMLASGGLTPAQVAQMTRAGKARNLPIAPAAPALLAGPGNQNQPLRILVEGAHVAR